MTVVARRAGVTSISLDLLNFLLPGHQHSLILGCNGRLLTTSPEGKAGVQDLPPHVNREQSKQGPFEDVRPAQSVSSLGPSQFKPERATAKHETNEEREMSLHGRHSREPHLAVLQFTLRYRLGVTHDVYFTGDEPANAASARRYRVAWGRIFFAP